MNITADRDLCGGNGYCTVAAPTIFALDDEDDLVVVLDPSPDAASLDEIRKAIQQCPMMAIALVE